MNVTVRMLLKGSCYSLACYSNFIGLLPTKAKDIVFRFIIEYSKLKGFWPLDNRSIFI
jgi:hypothetical protein